jgi:hypothetical protein
MKSYKHIFFKNNKNALHSVVKEANISHLLIEGYFFRNHIIKEKKKSS